uniref:Uncharacterized protein n=1 Tax=Rhizophora mucronata TaxID=61149 RepID=A0A2P2M3Y2_RHIMU
MPNKNILLSNLNSFFLDGIDLDDRIVF